MFIKNYVIGREQRSVEECLSSIHEALSLISGNSQKNPPKQQQKKPEQQQTKNPPNQQQKTTIKKLQ